jgi:creatinine amidohydrolase/Fe(II)-dependent formamide hydrolase-like protein
MDLAEDYMMSREELRRYRRGWLKVPESSSSGSIGRPTLATPEKGAAIYAHIREKVRAKVFLTPDTD